MTLSSYATIARFLEPVTAHTNIGVLQRILIKSGSPTGNPQLAATRCLALLSDLDLSSLLMTSVTRVEVTNPSPAILAGMATVQSLGEVISRYHSTILLALTESKKFLPAPTVDLLAEYTSGGSPSYRVGVSVFLVLTANLQDL